MNQQAPACDSDTLPGDQPERINCEALNWQVTLWSGEVTMQERRDFEHWLKADSAHRIAWDKLQRMNAPFDTVNQAIASRVLRAPSEAIHRRKVLLGLAALASVGIVGYGVQRTPHWQVATADYHTGRGERRTVILPDSTEVTLNTASALDVEFTASQRRLHLRRGEIMVVSAPDRPPQVNQPPRPLIVQTFAGEVRPIGTRFTVRQLDDASDSVQVQVFEGAVKLLPQHASQGDTRVRLDRGQQARFDRRQVSHRAPTTISDGAWSRGLLIAERQRLSDFITELGRHRAGVLRCDPAVADLIVSGVYPLKDTDAILQSLEQALPVRLSSLTGYWVTVTTP